MKRLLCFLLIVSLAFLPFVAEGAMEPAAGSYTGIDDKYAICQDFTSAGINAAIDTLGAEGGEVYLPEGEYTLTAPVVIDYHNTTLTGAGAGTILKAALWASWGGGADHLVKGTSVNYSTIQNLTIDGNSANTGQTKGLIRISGTHQRVANCNLLYSDDDAIDKPSGDFFVYTNNYIANADNLAISITGGEHGIISDSTIESSGGIWANDGHITVIGNHFKATATQAGVKLASDYSSAIGNTFDDCTGNGVESDGDYNAVVGNTFYRGANGTDSIKITANYNTISGNTAYSSAVRSERAIYLAGADYCVVMGNQSMGHDTCGIQIDADCQNTLLAGNNCTDTTPYVDNGTAPEDFAVGSISSTDGTGVQFKQFKTIADNDGITLTTADAGQTITVDDAGAQTVVLPSVAAGDAGIWFRVVKLGAGQVTIDAADSDTIADSGVGDTVYCSVAAEDYASITLQLASETEWTIIGGHGTWVTTD